MDQNQKRNEIVQNYVMMYEHRVTMRMFWEGLRSFKRFSKGESNQIRSQFYSGFPDAFFGIILSDIVSKTGIDINNI